MSYNCFCSAESSLEQVLDRFVVKLFYREHVHERLPAFGEDMNRDVREVDDGDSRRTRCDRTTIGHKWADYYPHPYRFYDFSNQLLQLFRIVYVAVA